MPSGIYKRRTPIGKGMKNYWKNNGPQAKKHRRAIRTGLARYWENKRKEAGKPAPERKFLGLFPY